MARRDGFRPNERITRDGLNQRLTAPASVNLSGPRVNKRRGDLVITDEEEIFIRLTGTAASPRRYAWQEVSHDNGTWKNTNRTGTVDNDPAFEVNNATLTAGTKVYTARRSRASGQWTFTAASGGGDVQIKSGDTRLMILGTYDAYKDCEGVPPKPPTTWADSCGTTRTTTLCVPAYAYAVYQRCGYIWQKVGDTRTFGVWANETNGGSTGAWGRFHVPCWGGDRDPVTWLPDPDADCIGVSFEANGGSAVSCSCPTWFTAITCLQITVKWIDLPAGDPPVNCSGCWDLMASRWGTQETIKIGYDDLGCVLQGDMGPFPVNLLWTQFDWGADCFWGPDEFDPCDPCTGFGKLVLSLNSAPRTSGGCGNPAGAWMSWQLKAKQLKDLICNCGTGPLRLSVASPALACGQLAEWVEISCCPGPGPELNLAAWCEECQRTLDYENEDFTFESVNFNTIPGLTILKDSSPITTQTYGDTGSPFAFGMTLSSDLQAFKGENPDVKITVTVERETIPYDGGIGTLVDEYEITGSTTITPSAIIVDDSPVDTKITVSAVMQAYPDPRVLFGSCCEASGFCPPEESNASGYFGRVLLPITYNLTSGSVSLDAGTPGSLPADIIDGLTPDSLPTDIIDGGEI